MAEDIKEVTKQVSDATEAAGLGQPDELQTAKIIKSLLEQGFTMKQIESTTEGGLVNDRLGLSTKQKRESNFGLGKKKQENKDGQPSTR